MGLIGGIARTAVIAGTATAVSNRVSRYQAGRWAAERTLGYIRLQLEEINIHFDRWVSQASF